MKTFWDVINRIKDILRTCNNGEHSFIIQSGGGTDCSAFPEVVSLDGYMGSVEKIYISENGKVVVKGHTEWDDFNLYLDDLSYDEVSNILTTMEEQLGMEVSPTFKKDTFHITSVCREDITALGYKGAENISDSVMEKIAQKMCDAYVANSFWSDLDFFVGEYCNLEKEEVDEDLIK